MPPSIVAFSSTTRRRAALHLPFRDALLCSPSSLRARARSAGRCMATARHAYFSSGARVPCSRFAA